MRFYSFALSIFNNRFNLIRNVTFRDYVANFKKLCKKIARKQYIDGFLENNRKIIIHTIASNGWTQR